MHIAEGFLPPEWSIAWFMFSITFLIYGSIKLKSRIANRTDKVLLAVSTGFIFVLSAMKVPSVTMSCSHPTGTGIAVVFFGPAITAVLSAIVLLYQALLLAHGGLTTLGANIASMGIFGPYFGWMAYKILRRNQKIAVFTATFVADLATYVMTSLQLALAFPANPSFYGFLDSAIRFLAIFAITQVPIAIIEAIIALAIFEQVINRIEVLQVSKT